MIEPQIQSSEIKCTSFLHLYYVRSQSPLFTKYMSLKCSLLYIIRVPIGDLLQSVKAVEVCN